MRVEYFVYNHRKWLDYNYAEVLLSKYSARNIYDIFHRKPQIKGTYFSQSVTVFLCIYNLIVLNYNVFVQLIICYVLDCKS